jgi:hypothetical protein
VSTPQGVAESCTLPDLRAALATAEGRTRAVLLALIRIKLSRLATPLT